MATDTKQHIYILNLREPYWSAGVKYKWKEDYSDLVGFGINREILRHNEEILITTKQGEYLLKRDNAVKFYNKYKTKQNIRGIEIIVIPRAICTVVKSY